MTPANTCVETDVPPTSRNVPLVRLHAAPFIAGEISLANDVEACRDLAVAREHGNIGNVTRGVAAGRDAVLKRQVWRFHRNSSTRSCRRRSCRRSCRRKRPRARRDPFDCNCALLQTASAVVPNWLLKSVMKTEFVQESFQVVSGMYLMAEACVRADWCCRCTDSKTCRSCRSR